MFGSIHSKRRKSHGFTLIELLVVIAIIAILAAILFPVFAKARDQAKLTRCLAQLGSIGKAIMSYTDDNNGYYPIGPHVIYSGNTKTIDNGLWTGQLIGACQQGTNGNCPKPPDTPLFKYTSGNLAIWKCPSEQKQWCSPTNTNTLPSVAWGTSYTFNGVYNWTKIPGDINFYCLMGVGKAVTGGITRKTSAVIHASKLWMVGEKTLHYYWTKQRGSDIPLPLGHMGDKPFSPAVFCDGHASVINLGSDDVVDPNGRWGFIEKGWIPGASYSSIGL